MLKITEWIFLWEGRLGMQTQWKISKVPAHWAWAPRRWRRGTRGAPRGRPSDERYIFPHTPYENLLFRAMKMHIGMQMQLCFLSTSLSSRQLMTRISLGAPQLLALSRNNIPRQGPPWTPSWPRTQWAEWEWRPGASSRADPRPSSVVIVWNEKMGICIREQPHLN